MGLLAGIQAANSLFEPVNAGIAQGTERRRQMGLASLMAGVAQGGTPDYQGVAKLGGDPMAFQKADRGNIEQQAKEVAQYGQMFLALPDDQKAAAYPQFASMMNALKLPHPPIPMEWNPAYVPGITQTVQALGGDDQQNRLPADIQTIQYYQQHPEAFAMQKELRQASANPFGFAEMTGADGITRLVQTNKREGGAAEIAPGGVPVGAGAGPKGAPNILDFATQAAQVLGGRITSGYRTAAEQAALRAQGKTTTVNSQHMDSTGVDMVFPNPQAKAQAIAYAQANGINALDEGNHVHFGVPRGVDVAGPNPYASRPAEQQAGLNAGAAEQAKVDVQVDNANRVGNAAGEVKAGEAVGADFGAQFNQIQQKANLAQAENSKLIPLRQLLSKSYTGPGANAYLGAQRAAAMMGLDVQGLGEAEAARAISNQLALQLRNPAGGEGMPGAMSDADRNFLVSSIPSLQNTPQGWRTLIDMRLSLNQYAIKQAQQAEQMRRDGVPVQDIPGKMREWAQANPIFKPQSRRAPPAGFRVLD